MKRHTASAADLFAHLSPAQRARLAAAQRDPRAAAMVLGRAAVVARAARPRDPVEVSVRAEGGAVALTLKGLRLVSVANAREHHHAKARRVARERALVGGALAGVTAPPGPWRVTIARVGPRALDTDNLTASAKAVRDAVAAWLGVDDGPEGPVAWVYGQRRGGYLVEVLVARSEP